ncbi:hypothetical protein ACFPES_26740 [Paenibacillus sp. GCM10023248]|nr:hypothetical protein [Paenibacillus sp. MAHUQ-63]
MDGRAHEGDAHDMFVQDELRELILVEVPQAGPQAYVGRIGGLRLQADQMLNRCEDGHVRTREKQLPGQEGAVEIAAADDLIRLVGHVQMPPAVHSFPL